MELQEALNARRSVRHYLPREVEEGKLCEMIEAAILAPSWKNSQVTRYYVVRGKETLASIKSALPEFNRNNVKDAPVLIVSTIVLNRSGFGQTGEPVNELGNGWGFYDCGLQTMNLLLKAAELGLSTLIMGIRDADKIEAVLDIPTTEAVVGVISVGYGEATTERPKRKSVEEIARFFDN